MASIHYHSTNRALSSERTPSIRFPEALMRGLAPDQGLYMFNQIPQLSPAEINSLRNKPYHEVAFHLLNLFLREDMPSEKLRQILAQTYTDNPKWPGGVKIPLVPLGKRQYLARLDQGPTASFKDFAAQWMSRMMQHFRSPDQQITILVATSGDTGSAVGEAFRGVTGTRVCILYPEQEVSLIQKKQLDSIGENVQAISLKAKFDDCQRIVKQAFNDQDLRHLNLTSANSINIGRLLPQMVYYVYIYLQVSQAGEEVIFSIPSGNLGNALGCEIARRVGVPIRKIIIGTNANNAFPHFLRAQVYQKIQPSKACISNAMNVGNPSNLARFFDLYGGTVDKEGQVYQLPELGEMQKYLVGYDFSDQATIETIQKVYNQQKILLEPHGAIGARALQAYLEEFPEEKRYTSVVIETAHPAKFPEVIESCLHFRPQNSLALDRLNQREGSPVYLDNDYQHFKDYLLQSGTSDAP